MMSVGVNGPVIGDGDAEGSLHNAGIASEDVSYAPAYVRLSVNLNRRVSEVVPLIREDDEVEAKGCECVVAGARETVGCVLTARWPTYKPKGC